MLKWMNRRKLIDRAPLNLREEPVSPPTRRMSGKYALLYDYLANRYANRVVLTFAQIEDLLGFSLPELARVHQEWWTNPDPEPLNHSDSWVLASRTARPNLFAKTVLFERL